MNWLWEPLWLAYPTAALLILTAMFAWSVRWWLREFPVAPLNHVAERPYAETYRKPAPTNYWQNFGVMAASAATSVAIAYHPEPFLYDPRTGKRIR